MFGFLNINKPKGMTSHKVISILRKITGIKRIGHAGTLDPLAQGVLPVAIGKASKLIDFLEPQKAYIVSMKLGYVSDTFDIEGKVEQTNYRKISQEEAIVIVNRLKGEITQTPPAFSAVHHNGKRLYELARKGEIPLDIPQRKIFVYENKILNFDYENQILKLYIECSKGTYIRTIVNDTGKFLKCGAVMEELIRTFSSGMFIENSLEITDDLTVETIKENLINPLQLIDMKNIEISDTEFKRIQNGNRVKNNTNIIGRVLLKKNNEIIGIAAADSQYIQPEKILL